MLDEKERLDRTNLSPPIFQKEIAMFEFRIERLLHHFVKAVVLAFPREGPFPLFEILEIFQGKNSRGALWEGDGLAGRHINHGTNHECDSISDLAT